MKRILAIIMALMVALSTLSLTVTAVDNNTVTPRYSYINVINSSLSISKLGLATCKANSGFFNGASQILTCKLQRYNGSGWTTIKTWSSTSEYSTAITKQYAVPSGYTYRLRATCSIYNASGTLLEVGICDSNQVTY